MSFLQVGSRIETAGSVRASLYQTRAPAAPGTLRRDSPHPNRRQVFTIWTATDSATLMVTLSPT
jgi:hypothetical protein